MIGIKNHISQPPQLNHRNLWNLPLKMNAGARLLSYLHDWSYGLEPDRTELKSNDYFFIWRRQLTFKSLMLKKEEHYCLRVFISRLSSAITTIRGNIGLEI